MDWNAAIERNREALKRILASLVAMAGLPVLRACGDAGIAGGAAFASPQGQGTRGGRREASGGGSVATITPTRRSDDRRPPHKGEVELPATLPRHLYRAVLRLLRPAEAAARRLIIVAARGLAVPPPRPRKANPAPTILRNGLGIAIVMPHARPGTVYFFPHNRAAGSGPDISGKKVNCPPRSTVRPPAFPLFDPLRRPFRRRRPKQSGVPRISVPGYSAPFSLPPPPSPGDPIDVARLHLRLAALAAALDDLPGQARRFARWKAARDAALYPPPCEGAKDGRDPWLARRRATGAERRIARRGGGAAVQDPHPAASRPPSPQGGGWRGRAWPLRLGRPPGSHRPPLHQVHEILDDLHGLAFDVLERPDTS